MALNQFTSDWNDTFLLKISVGDIKKPTQSFLYEVFDFFLGTIYIDTDKLKGKMDERHYKIWLVRYYNDFFETCNRKCYPLYYGDLLHPESKKVLEILRFLLNFRLFHKAAQKEIVDTANGKNETYNQWVSKKNQLQLHREEAKIQKEQKELILMETTRSIAEYKQRLAQLTATNARLTKETEEAKGHLYRIRVENIDLSSQIDSMGPSIVTEHELKALSKTIQAMENSTAELNAIKEDLQTKNQCFADETGRLNAEIDELSANVNKIGVVESVEKERNEMKTLTDLKNKVEEFRNQTENTVAEREKLQETIKSVEAHMLVKKNDLSLLSEQCQTKQRQMEVACQRGSFEAADLDKKCELLAQKIEQLKATQDELITMGIQVIDHIENS